MRIPILKRDNKYYIEIPDELANSNEAEIFQLRDGFYLLSVPLESVKGGAKRPAELSNAVVSEEEKNVLRKLLTVKFEKRIPKEVEKLFNTKEQAMVKTLLAKSYLNIYTSKKYPDGVYNIKDSVYPLLRQNPPTSSVPPVPAPEQRSTEPAPKQADDNDFMIINDTRAAQEFSEKFKKQLRSGELIGIRGFDGKFYVVSKDYYLKLLPHIRRVLEKDADTTTIAKSANIGLDAAKAILVIMSEKGEIIEKKKGMFSLV